MRRRAVPAIGRGPRLIAPPGAIRRQGVTGRGVHRRVPACGRREGAPRRPVRASARSSPGAPSSRGGSTAASRSSRCRPGTSSRRRSASLPIDRPQRPAAPAAAVRRAPSRRSSTARVGSSSRRASATFAGLEAEAARPRLRDHAEIWAPAALGRRTAGASTTRRVRRRRIAGPGDLTSHHMRFQGPLGIRNRSVEERWRKGTCR